MTLARSPLRRRTALKPGKPLSRGKHRLVAKKAPGRRRGAPRRPRAPIPLPPIDGSPTTLHVDESEAAFGPQSDLCRETECAACWAMRMAALGMPLDWRFLPAKQPGTIVAPHHEPPRGLSCRSTDADTLPLCLAHHTGPFAFAVRHGDRFNYNPDGFYAAVHIPDYRAVRDEMRRRTAALKEPTP